MIPYIAILVVLIVAVLFAVYKRVDGFAIRSFQIAETTKVQDIVTYANDYLSFNEALKTKLDAMPSFDETITREKATELDIPFPTEKPISVAISKGITQDIDMVKRSIDMLTARLNSGSLKPETTVKDAIQNPNRSLAIPPINALLEKKMKIANAREAFINAKATPTTSNQETTILSILGGVREAIRASAIDSSGNHVDTSMNEAAPETSEKSTKEIEDRIAMKVASHLKDSLLSQRSTENVYDEMPCPYAPYSSDAEAQGREYTHAKPSSTPDMSQYIRKDSIPCWNCSLPE